MSILVLGGAGYIGSHTVYELIDRGEDVVVVDNLQTGFKAAVHPKARFYEGDIRDKAFLDDLFTKEKIDGVIHFAANSQVGESMKVPLKYYDNNLYGTMVLLESMVEHGIDKIVFSSTAATYGEPERIPILESDRTEPTNTYGETKLSMEKMMKWTSKAHNLRYVALRYFNACGAHISGKIGEAHNPETHLSSFANSANVSGDVFGFSAISIQTSLSFSFANSANVSGGVFGFPAISIQTSLSFSFANSAKVSGSVLGFPAISIQTSLSFANSAKVSGGVLGLLATAMRTPQPSLFVNLVNISSGVFGFPATALRISKLSSFANSANILDGVFGFLAV